MESVEPQEEQLEFSYKRLKRNERLTVVTSHDVLISLLLAATTATLIAAIVTNGIVFVVKGGNINSGGISGKTLTCITPAKWSLPLTGAIYVTQFLWVLHAWSFSFRPTASRTISWITCLLFCAANTLEIAWTSVLAKRREHFALVLILETGLFLYIALWEECSYLSKKGSQLRIRGLDLWLTRILAMNGLAAYATWTNIKFLVNLAATLQYFTHLSAVSTATIVMLILSVETLVYFILESTVFAKTVRWVYAIYPVQLWFLAGILSVHWRAEGEEVSGIFVLAVFVVTALFMFVKFCLHARVRRM